jgi:hypothetical protein
MGVILIVPRITRMGRGVAPQVNRIVPCHRLIGSSAHRLIGSVAEATCLPLFMLTLGLSVSAVAQDRDFSASEQRVVHTLNSSCVGQDCADEGVSVIGYDQRGRTHCADDTCLQPVPDEENQSAAELYRQLMSGDRNAQVMVQVEFRRDELDLTRLGRLREDRVAVMQATTQESLGMADTILSEYELEVVSRRQLRPALTVRGSGYEVAELLAVPDVVSAYEVLPVEPVLEYAPVETREAVQGGLLNFGGADGLTGGRVSGGRIRIAVIDPGTLWCTHPSFRDSGTGSRILTRKTCSTTGCVVDDSEVCSTNDDGYTHGTAVSFLALGDYLDGQVSTLSATTRELLTSAAHEANLLYYHVPGSTSNTTFGDRVEAALEQAVTDGADIIVMSFALQVVPSSFESQLCSATYNPGGINATLKNVVDAGVVIIK